MLSTDGKDVGIVARKSREHGPLLALTKNGRNAVVWERDKWSESILKGLTTIEAGETVKVGNTDDDRTITLISSVKAGKETVSFVLSAGADGGTGRVRNALSVARADVRYLAGMVAPELLGSSKLVTDIVEMAKRSLGPPADDFYHGCGGYVDGYTWPEASVSGLSPDQLAHVENSQHCPTCGRGDE